MPCHSIIATFHYFGSCYEFFPIILTILFVIFLSNSLFDEYFTEIPN